MSRGAGNKIDFECGIEPVIKSAILRGITSAFVSGIFGYPIIDINVSIFSIVCGANKISESAFESISGFAFHSIFQKSDPIRLEPIMLLEIRTPIEHTGEIISTLNVMGGVIHSVSNIGEYDLIKSEAAFEKLFGYASILRSSTKGRGSFTMEFSYFKEKLS
ncbi:Elongation factor G [Borreliella burgdorferi 29805]|nr:Elongation factor G [Borreliella burgdorferi 29805]